MFGQSWLIGKAAELLVSGATGNPAVGKAAHLIASGITATLTFDPHGHAASWADVSVSAADTLFSDTDNTTSTNDVLFGGYGQCFCGCAQFYSPNGGSDTMCICGHPYASH